MNFKPVTKVTELVITLTKEEALGLNLGLGLLRDRYDQDTIWPNETTRRFARDLRTFCAPFPKE